MRTLTKISIRVVPTSKMSVIDFVTRIPLIFAHSNEERIIFTSLLKDQDKEGYYLARLLLLLPYVTRVEISRFQVRVYVLGLARSHFCQRSVTKRIKIYLRWRIRVIRVLKPLFCLLYPKINGEGIIENAHLN